MEPSVIKGNNYHEQMDASLTQHLKTINIINIIIQLKNKPSDQLQQMYKKILKKKPQHRFIIITMNKLIIRRSFQQLTCLTWNNLMVYL